MKKCQPVRGESRAELTIWQKGHLPTGPALLGAPRFTTYPAVLIFLACGWTKKGRQKPQGLRPQKYNNVTPKSEVPEIKSNAFN
jgi:hypothetical protein